jgi:hypothetical protein
MRETSRGVPCAGLRLAEDVVNPKIFRATGEAEVIFPCIGKMQCKFSGIRH